MSSIRNPEVHELAGQTWDSIRGRKTPYQPPQIVKMEPSEVLSDIANGFVFDLQGILQDFISKHTTLLKSGMLISSLLISLKELDHKDADEIECAVELLDIIPSYNSFISKREAVRAWYEEAIRDWIEYIEAELTLKPHRRMCDEELPKGPFYASMRRIENGRRGMFHAANCEYCHAAKSHWFEVSIDDIDRYDIKPCPTCITLV